jgi:hypothetical protein
MLINMIARLSKQVQQWKEFWRPALWAAYVRMSLEWGRQRAAQQQWMVVLGSRVRTCEDSLYSC